MHSLRWLQIERTLHDMWDVKRAPVNVPEALVPKVKRWSIGVHQVGDSHSPD